MTSTDISPSAPPPIGGWKEIKLPYALITLVLFILAWELIARLADIPVYLLPRPTAIVSALYENCGLLVANGGVTLTEILIGFVIAVLLGVPLATIIAHSPAVDRAVYPLIVGSQTIPKAAIAPLLLAAFGYGLTPKVTIVALMSFFPIVINAVVGFKSASPEMLHLAYCTGATPMQIFWLFRLPQALPSIFAGMKLAAVLSVIGAVVAEFVGSQSGLGYVILVAGSNFRMDQQFAAIIFLSVMGMILFWVIGLAEKKVLPWHASMRASKDG
jgi:NitT/TauT family transport system permease protein